MENVMNYNIGNQALKNILANDSLDVGRVTVRHLPFSEALVQLNAAKDEVPEDVKAIFNIGFGNNGGETEYVSPLGNPEVQDNNIPTQGIDILKSDVIVANSREMKLTKNNCMAALTDLHANGRMGQEMSIDTFKTSDPVLCLDYAQAMSNVKMMSRKRSDNDFNFEVDWRHCMDEDKKRIILEPDHDEFIGRKEHGWKRFCGVKYVCDERPSYTTVKKLQDGTKQDVRVIHDFQQDLRILSLKAGCTFAKEFAKMKQQFSQRTLAWMETSVVPKHTGACQVAEFLKQAYSSISNVQATRIRDIRDRYPDRYKAEAHIKDLKKDMAPFYTYLAKTLRFQMRDLSASMRAAVLVSVIMVGDNKEDSQYSSYAHGVLDKEFLAFVLQIFKDEDKVAKYTEDKLISCTFKEGDVAEFVFGEAYGDDGKFAKAADDELDGEFTIRKNKNGHLVASKLIKEVLAPEDPDGSVLCFITKGSDWGDENLTAVMKKMEDKEVTLIPYRKQQDGKDLHDAIVVDGKMIGKFRTSLGSDNPESIQAMYRNKTGKITGMISCELEMKVSGKHGVQVKKNHKVALVLMSDVKDSQDTEFVEPLDMKVSSAKHEVRRTGRLSGRYCKPAKEQVAPSYDVDENGVPVDGMAYFESVVG
jgi:hypothetical protein